ncbi:MULTISPECIES: HEXXH motif domain-containing protein [unclassified Solwaraspora]|uniref:HEXXH motif domain-containing protein n=1 Tax=unclassified Solwaraspora TaxID=2627926 RepID=UPI00248BE327|nr:MULTISPECIES: HEXXH motif domain-containing protein [unclassified Solwaraspora]WBB99795.1 HEXXH motif domain-containing protein [Solwaraspora sp. WMMA2059]WBC21657.1 HEXXH motif domain-containing protein [Solwaraspora sp. WMMA2080]WJK36282.1 HEXXH motif domain-containing protein [Solwaraspora sp. WMMA2065]
MTGRAAVPTHAIAVDDFRQLATTGGDERTAAALRGSERSWRLTALRALVDAVARRTDAAGPLSGVDTAWQLLVRADRADPDATEEVVAQPQVGIWVAHTLRRLTSARSGDPPLWVDVGYLHSLAAAAAVRAGLSFDLVVPARHGHLALPTVAAVELPPRIERVQVVAAAGTVTVTAGGGDPVGPGDPHWHPPVRLVATAGGIDLRVELLDRDVYRDLRGPAAPAPLSTDQVRRWQAQLQQAWELLVRQQPQRARTVAAILRTVAPLPARERFRQLSASGAEAFGTILLSEPDDATQLAMTLVHEIQHHKLGALAHLLTLVNDDPDRRFYAPWRDDPRPVAGLLQGVYAFAGITDFWRVHRRHAPAGQVALANFEFALWRRQTRHAVRSLLDSGRLTGHGTRFVEILHDTVATFGTEQVPAGPQRLADRMAVDHRALWRAHNLRLDAAARTELAAAWAGRRPLPACLADARDGRPATLTRPDRAWFDARAVLTRHRLTDPAGFDRLTAAPDTVTGLVTGATAADVALVGGDADRARAGYLRQLAADLAAGTTAAHSWIGLGLTWPDGSTHPAVRALLHRPELVMETLRQAARRGAPVDVPDPVELAAWVGAGLPADAHRPADPAGWLLLNRTRH